MKSARQSAKQAFDRLESRVLRPDKVKIEGVESGVRGQQGEERVKRKLRPHPPLEQRPHDAYWTSLAPHEHVVVQHMDELLHERNITSKRFHSKVSVAT